MKSNEKIVEYLFKTGAFRVLNEPTILTSGNLGIYYINTEKLLQDKGEWESYGNDSEGMIYHAMQLTKKNDIFKDVIRILFGEVEKHVGDKNYAISGGERRDWLFSGPVANALGVEHISLFKNGDIKFKNINLERLCVFHVADLMTTGSSAYDPRNEPPTGWIQTLRNRGAIINQLFNVVTRLQGGEETLKKIGINTTSLVAINAEFLEMGYKKGLITKIQKDISLDYMKDPDLWSKEYLIKNTIVSFVSAFSQEGKIDRARKFLRVYEKTLKECGKWNELESLVKTNNKIDINNL